MEGIKKTKMEKKIEAKFEDKDMEIILKETTRKHKNIVDQSLTLGVSIPYLYHLIRKYFGDFTTFMLAHTKGKRRKRYIKEKAKQTLIKQHKKELQDLKNISLSNF
jgi:hypothetical protein